ncbi:unnamed protein product, partial [Allacma fusca]
MRTVTTLISKSDNEREATCNSLSYGLFAEATLDIEVTFDVNFKSYVHVAQIIVKEMIKNKIENGTIVNISSVTDQRLFMPGLATD